MSVRKNLNLGSSQMRERRRRLFWIRFYIILFFVLITIFGLAILSGHQRVTINTILISGNDSVLNSEILDISNQALAGRYFGLFARKNILIFPRLKITKDLKEHFKIIKDVNLSWKNWQTITIKIVERKPHSVWCGPDVKNLEADCYFVDESGYIFDRAPVFSGSIFIRNYRILESVEPINSYLFPTDLYVKLFTLISLLDKKEIGVTKVSFDGLDFRFSLLSGQTIIFTNKENNFIEAFQNFFTALETKNIDLVKDSANINYIDLRFADKIVIGKNETKK